MRIPWVPATGARTHHHEYLFIRAGTKYYTSGEPDHCTVKCARLASNARPLPTFALDSAFLLANLVCVSSSTCACTRASLRVLRIALTWPFENIWIRPVGLGDHALAKNCSASQLETSTETAAKY
jgi:hypothetical protein